MPIILCTVLIFIIWFKYEREKSERLSGKSATSFWSREYKANFIRKSDLSDLDFIVVPLEDLPLMETDDPMLLEYQEKIRMLAGKKIINFTGLSNTDLKYKYGTANITILTQYDENFTKLARELFNWGRYLYEHQFTDEAVTVLEYAISCKTDVSGNYKLLANIYKERGDSSKIHALLDHARDIPSLMKNTIIASLENLLEP